MVRKNIEGGGGGGAQHVCPISTVSLKMLKKKIIKKRLRIVYSSITWITCDIVSVDLDLSGKMLCQNK